MAKILASWSGMRKYLEKEMLATSLQGRIRYNCTRYVGMDDCHIFEVYIDGNKVKSFSWETVNTYFIQNGLKENNEPCGTREYWDEFWSVLDKIPLLNRSEYTDEEFCEALARYRNQQIEHSLTSENPIIQMFAILDKRVGKRQLRKLNTSVNIQPEWLKQFYTIRLEAEQIRI